MITEFFTYTKTKCIYLPDYLKCIVSKCDIFQLSSLFPFSFPFSFARCNRNRDPECFEELVEKDAILICQNHIVASLCLIHCLIHQAQTVDLYLQSIYIRSKSHTESDASRNELRVFSFTETTYLFERRECVFCNLIRVYSAFESSR